MRRRVLGKTGIEVSELGLGGLFTSSLGPGYEQSKSVVQRAFDLGINFVDTAPAYANSEEVLGKILGEVTINEPLIMTTKFGGRPQPFDPRNKEQLMWSIEESLKLLKREVIDILIIHEPDRPLLYDWWTDPEEVHGPVLEVMDELKEDGVIRFTGLGGTTVTEMSHYVRSGKFDVLLTAFNYSALFREAENDLIPAALEQNMGIIIGSTLQQGGLGRRYDDVVRAKPAWMSKGRQQQFLAFYELLDELGMPIVELCLRFAISNQDISTVLIGAKTAGQLEESVNAVNEGPLDVDVIGRLNEIAAMMPCRPFEEPQLLPMGKPYYGPGIANLGMGVQVGKLDLSEK